MCAEAIGAADVTADYRNLRRAHLRPSKADLQEVERRLRDSGDGTLPALLLHQWEYLAHSWKAMASFNTSEQGLGKTRMTLALMRIWGNNRVLLFCPKDLAEQWQQEMAAIWPNPADRPRFINATQGTLVNRAELIRANLPAGEYQDKHPVILAVNYEAVVTLERYLQAFWANLLVADESWKIKNPKAKATRAVIRLADHSRQHYGNKRQVPRAIALAGTPIGNDIGDLWSQLRFLGKPYAPDTYSQFLFRYAVLRPLHLPGRTLMQPVGVSDPAGLMTRLDPVWFRATKGTCLNLPDKIRRQVYLDLPPSTRKLYDEVKRDGEAALGDDRSLAGEATITLRLQQITGGHQPQPGIEELDEEKWTLKPLTRCPKLEWVKEWAETTLLSHPSTRCIIWCNFRSEANRIAKELVDLLGLDRVALAVGGTSTEQLERIKAGFNSREEDEVQVIVATNKRLAYGHNLQAADWMIYFSASWSYIEHAQSEDRAHRFGRSAPVNYVHLIARKTVDEDIFKALKEHTDVATRLAPCVATGGTGGRSAAVG